MSSETFTPSNAVDTTNERGWAANLGMLDWDDTKIVFTKRSLLEFLKYVDVTVDPNFSNIQKLPRYARFGKISDGGTSTTASQATSPIVEPSSGAASPEPAADSGFRPTRRVRDVPGGAHTRLFGSDEPDDALASAPQKQVAPADQGTTSPQPDRAQVPPAEVTPDAPARPRRTTSSGVAGLWDAPDENQFKPTRRVRERPGGRDNIADLF
ncbi:hypothetical protein CERSUDRAFT_117364 [Gelatoporia subvermispora B]|uniref:Uncharacterized protein n=1 Tax=Ceriporiopsis subvermispora (strain B) TaxID=914234 RepID=M2QC07_CERS8|nr:hypothetical protein CERSUDRAFT_117364 [Gelatoporia subvermispora B]